MENSGYDIIGKIVSGIIDRPIGSQHPSNSDIIYPINYGYVENVFADDGEEQDVYVFCIFRSNGALIPLQTA